MQELHWNCKSLIKDRKETAVATTRSDEMQTFIANYYKLARSLRPIQDSWSLQRARVHHANSIDFF